MLRLTVGDAAPGRRACCSASWRGHALDELWALFSVLLRPDQLIAARLARRRTRRGSARAAQRLLAPRGSGCGTSWRPSACSSAPGPGRGRGRRAPRRRERSDRGRGRRHAALGQRTGTSARRPARTAAERRPGRARAARVPGAVRRRAADGGCAAARPPTRRRTSGAPTRQAWHPVGIGSATDSPPYLAVVSLLGLLLLNHVSTRGRPAAARRRAAGGRQRLPRAAPRRVRRCRCAPGAPPPMRCCRRWSVRWQPAGSRPQWSPSCCRLTLLLVSHAVGLRDAAGDNRAAWGAGLLLAVMTAFAPLVYLVALVLLGLAARDDRAGSPRHGPAGRRRRRAAAPAAAVAAGAGRRPVTAAAGGRAARPRPDRRPPRRRRRSSCCTPADRGCIRCC